MNSPFRLFRSSRRDTLDHIVSDINCSSVIIKIILIGIIMMMMMHSSVGDAKLVNARIGRIGRRRHVVGRRNHETERNGRVNVVHGARARRMLGDEHL